MRPLISFGLCAALFFSLLVTGCRTNPVTGKSNLVLLSEQQELALGHRQHPNIIYMYDGEYQDTELKRYLGTIVMRLRNVSHRRNMPVDFTVLNTSVINAFATPGHVYATRGFLAELENEAQFASVMGHELTHVVAGHSAQQMSTKMLTAAGLQLTSKALPDSESKQALLVGGQLGAKLLGLSYSRQQEHQADRVGTYYMALAGWDPRAAVSMQKLLASFNKHKSTVLDKYLSTHPPDDERISDIRAVIRDKNLTASGYIQGDGKYKQRWERRLRELKKVDQAFQPYDKGVKALNEGEIGAALQFAQEALNKRRDQAPFHRLKGDVLARQKKYRRATEAYQKALEVDPRYAPAEIGIGKVALHQEAFAEAEKAFSGAANDYPASLEARYGLGLARYYQGKYREAIPPLEKVTGSTANAGLHFYRLGHCHYEIGNWKNAYGYLNEALQRELPRQKRANARAWLKQLRQKLDTAAGNADTDA